MANQCVCTFNAGNRKISMYFTEDEEGLDMQMTVTPEFKDGDEPDLPMLLASALLNAIQKKEDYNDEQPKIITN